MDRPAASPASPGGEPPSGDDAPTPPPGADYAFPLPDDLTGVERLRWERLASALSELDLRVGRGREAGAAAGPVARAADSRDRAVEAFHAGEDQAAWAHVQQGFRHLLAGLSLAEMEARRTALRAEAAEKLSNWRRQAVLEVLDGDGEEDVAPEALAFAQSLLDQHFANVYFKLAAAALRFRTLNAGLAVAAAALLALALVLEGDAVGGSLLADAGALVSVMAAGTVGAMLSSTLSQLSFGARIPDYLSGIAEWTLRPLLGALSAVAVCVLVQSGLLPLTATVPPGLYGWAVAAGFSDQLLNVVMRRVEASATR